NIGLVLLIGLILAFPLWYLSGYLWGLRVGRKYPLEVPAILGEVDTDQPTNAPRVGTVIGLLLLPLVLIFLNTGLDFLRAAGAVDSDATWYGVLTAIGSTPIALLISVLVAVLVLGTRDRKSVV